VNLYFEASALTKVYTTEEESQRVIAAYNASTPFISRLSLVEVISAVSRKFRKGEISVDDRGEIVSVLRRDEARLYVLELTEDVAFEAQKLLLRHTLKASDSIQLACFSLFHRRYLHNVELVCFDAQILTAASNENLPIFSL
jgi:predicted nucleic acid-binding protein